MWLFQNLSIPFSVPLYCIPKLYWSSKFSMVTSKQLIMNSAPWIKVSFINSLCISQWNQTFKIISPLSFVYMTSPSVRVGYRSLLLSVCEGMCDSNFYYFPFTNVGAFGALMLRIETDGFFFLVNMRYPYPPFLINFDLKFTVLVIKMAFWTFFLGPFALKIFFQPLNIR